MKYIKVYGALFSGYREEIPLTEKQHDFYINTDYFVYIDGYYRNGQPRYAFGYIGQTPYIGDLKTLLADIDSCIESLEEIE